MKGQGEISFSGKSASHFASLDFDAEEEHSSAAEFPEQANSDEPDEEGFPGKGNPAVFDAVFGWLRDLLASIFGGWNSGSPSGDPDDEQTVEDPPSLANDVIFIEYIPVVPVENEDEVLEDGESDPFDGIPQLL